MQKAAEVLDNFGVAYEKKVVSAHRTPDLMFKHAEEARSRGIKVIIAGAGMAAHLGGVIASLTTLPVIGVPIKTSMMGGLDSLLSMVQMPSGVPVATVAVNGAANAAILAAQMLAISDEEVHAKLVTYKDDMRETVMEKDAKLQRELGE